MTQTKTMASGSVTRLTQIPTVSKDIPKVKVFESRSKSNVNILGTNVKGLVTRNL